MYCGQCGKKVMENMLFCPFCGAPIVIPEQDEPAPPRGEAKPAPRTEPAARTADEAAETSASPARGIAGDAMEAPASAGKEGMPGVRAAEESALHAQAGAPQTQSVPEARAPEAASERPVSLFDALDEPPKTSEPAPEFVPLHFDDDLEDARPHPPAPEIEDAPETPARPQVRRTAPRELHPTESARRRAAQTYIPVKEVDPEDLFMDDGTQDDPDEYDLDFDAGDTGRYADSFEFEEAEEGGFFQRHIRGIVGLALLAVLVVICAVWMFSSGGQRALAKMNLAWTAQPYADLGYAAYAQDSDLQAARYYEKAASIDPDNYEYAHSAMVAYYEAEEIESAADMLKKCIALNPDSAEPYEEMLILYPDSETRPWEIQELIRQGYARTGDEALNQDAQE